MLLRTFNALRRDELFFALGMAILFLRKSSSPKIPKPRNLPLICPFIPFPILGRLLQACSALHCYIRWLNDQSFKNLATHKYQLLDGSRILLICFDFRTVHPSRNIYKILGEAIRAQRKKARLSQEKLAEKANFTRNYIGEIERGEKKPTVEAIARLAKVLKCRVRDLFWDL